MASGFGGVPSPPERQRSWFGRNWLWFVPTVILLPVVACGACCGSIFWFARGAVMNSVELLQSLPQVQADDRCHEALGVPITLSNFNFSSNSTTSGDVTEKTVEYDVSGPKGKATVHVESETKSGGVPEIKRLEVRPEGGDPIVLIPKPEGEAAPPETAPATEGAAAEGESAGATETPAAETPAEAAAEEPAADEPKSEEATP